MAVKLENNTFKVEEAIAEGLSGFLNEVGGEVQSQARRKVREDTGQTKGSYDYKIRESVLAGIAEVQVGSDYDNAIYEEFGTGQYALGGNGRKTPWVYEDETGVWHRTSGKKPTRPLYTAFNTTAPKIKKQLANVIKSAGG